MFLPGSMISVYQIANEQKRACNYGYILTPTHMHAHVTIVQLTTQNLPHHSM